MGGVEGRGATRLKWGCKRPGFSGKGEAPPWGRTGNGGESGGHGRVERVGSSGSSTDDTSGGGSGVPELPGRLRGGARWWREASGGYQREREGVTGVRL